VAVFNRDAELEALTALCRKLASLGLNVGMSDARPAISVRADMRSPRLWVSVDDSGEAFTWCCDGNGRHDVDDLAGAAEQIAAYLKSRDGEQS
jgi:hypothetical protein